MAALMLTFFSATYAGERNQGDGINFDSNSAEYAPGSKSGGKSAVSSIVQLSSYPVFDKYKRHKDCVLTVINNPTMNYRELKVNGNAKIVAEIRALVEKDISLSDNVIRNYKESSDDIVAIYGFGTLGYTEYINTDSCKIFIGGS